jgi:hypothetical protein
MCENMCIETIFFLNQNNNCFWSNQNNFCLELRYVIVMYFKVKCILIYFSNKEPFAHLVETGLRKEQMCSSCDLDEVKIMKKMSSLMKFRSTIVDCATVNIGPCIVQQYCIYRSVFFYTVHFTEAQLVNSQQSSIVFYCCRLQVDTC